MESEDITFDRLSRSCRTCISECSHMNPLFARDPDSGLGLDDLLMSCTNLKILEIESFPNSICDRCFVDLKSAYQFKQRCESADRYFKRLGIKLNSEYIKTTTVLGIKQEEKSDGEDEDDWNSYNSVENEAKQEESLTITNFEVFIEGDNKEGDVLRIKEEKEYEGNGEEQHGDSETYAEYQHFLDTEIRNEDSLEVIDKTKVIQDNNIEKNRSINDRLDLGYPPGDNNHLLKENFQEHEQTHSGKKSYKCDICDKSFSYSSHLRDHKNSHTGRKLYKCDICEKSYLYSSNLREHRLTHSVKKLFKCDICDKSYSYDRTLQEHKRTHGAKNGFKCDLCDKSYSHVRTLRDHKKTHNEQMVYKCDICDKSYKYSNNLREHKLTHSAEKPYKCDVCDKSYSYSSNLRGHKRTHEKVEVKRDVCSEEFSN